MLSCILGIRNVPKQHPIEVAEPLSTTATVATTSTKRTPETEPPTTYEHQNDKPQPTELKQTTQPPMTTIAQKPAEPKPQVTKPQTTHSTTKPKPATANPTEKTEPSIPQNGDTKDGYIYLKGFGWIENQGGGGNAEYAEDMYENRNRIGYGSRMNLGQHRTTKAKAKGEKVLNCS